MRYLHGEERVDVAHDTLSYFQKIRVRGKVLCLCVSKGNSNREKDAVCGVKERPREYLKGSHPVKV